MRAFGLDAGKATGFAIVEVSPRGTAVHIASGVLPGYDRTAEVDDVLSLFPNVERVAVELPAQVFPKLAARDGSAKNLIAATAIGAELAGHLRAKGHVVEMLTANDWRRGLGCLRGDKLVARIIRLRIPNWPKVSRTHARDAAGAAIFIALRAMNQAQRSVDGRRAGGNR